MRFKDRVVIVTGAARGIGATTAEAFAREGARVAAVDLDASGVEATVKRLRDAGADALGFRSDVAAAAEVTTMVQAVLGRWRRVDVLVNNAGGFSAMRLTEDITDQEWDGILRSNLTSAFVCSRAVLPTMKRQRAGRIVNVSSVVARGGVVRTTAHYTAAKAGVIGLTRHLAAEVADHGITVNAVAPGTTATERVVALRTPEDTARLAATIPLRRLGEPADIADSILYLASDAARWVTGVVLDVNGGQVMA
ncbi:MAG: SDR family oxidoreductase [Candidatus Rokubacteria bacterium]|nr:SDR family oxidoreductase [Candidatus Rokubacteria bacterium]